MVNSVMNPYKITIHNLRVNSVLYPNKPNYVIEVLTTISTEKNGVEVAVGHYFDLTQQPAAESFVDFDQLNEQQVMSWITSPGLANQLQDAYDKLNEIHVPDPDPFITREVPWQVSNTSTIAELQTTSTSTPEALDLVTVLGLATEEKVKVLIAEALNNKS